MNYLKQTIESLTERQLDFAFAKIFNMLLGEDTVIMKNEQGNMSCYHISHFKPTQNINLINKILKHEKINLQTEKISRTKNNTVYNTTYNNKTVTDTSETISIMKAILYSKTDGTITLPEKIKF